MQKPKFEFLAGIYQIRNTQNNNRYIGSSIRLNGRFAEHVSELSRNCHHSPILQNAWNKYKQNTFVFEVLIYCDPENCLMYEQIVLDDYQPKYNVCKIAGRNITGQKLTDHNVKEILETIVDNPNLLYGLIAEEYGVSLSLISAIATGRHRAHIMLDDPIKQTMLDTLRHSSDRTLGEKHASAKLTNDQVMMIKTLIAFCPQVSLTEIAKMFDVGLGAIRKIRAGQSWKTSKNIDQLLYDYIRSPKAQAEIKDENLDWTCPVSLTYAMERGLVLHTKLFQLENAVRNSNLSDEEIGKLKRKIDSLNGQVRPRLIQGMSDLFKQVFCKKDPAIIDETSTKDYQARE